MEMNKNRKKTEWNEWHNELCPRWPKKDDDDQEEEEYYPTRMADQELNQIQSLEKKILRKRQ